MIDEDKIERCRRMLNPAGYGNVRDTRTGISGGMIMGDDKRGCAELMGHHQQARHINLRPGPRSDTGTLDIQQFALMIEKEDMDGLAWPVAACKTQPVGHIGHGSDCGPLGHLSFQQRQRELAGCDQQGRCPPATKDFYLAVGCPQCFGDTSKMVYQPLDLVVRDCGQTSEGFQSASAPCVNSRRQWALVPKASAAIIGQDQTAVTNR